jgi:beta-xylosidase
VYAYSDNDSSWKQLGNDLDGEAAYDESGRSVSLSSDGKTVAIGAVLNDGTNVLNSGHVRVYTYSENNMSWKPLGNDLDGEAADDRSGYSVSLSSDGKTVAIGALYNDGTNGTDSGQVRLYQFQSV